MEKEIPTLNQSTIKQHKVEHPSTQELVGNGATLHLSPSEREKHTLELNGKEFRLCIEALKIATRKLDKLVQENGVEISIIEKERMLKQASDMNSLSQKLQAL